MEEAGILENTALLSSLLPDIEPGQKSKFERGFCNSCRPDGDHIRLGRSLTKRGRVARGEWRVAGDEGRQVPASATRVGGVAREKARERSQFARVLVVCELEFMPNTGGIALDERSQSANVGREAREFNWKITIGRGSERSQIAAGGQVDQGVVQGGVETIVPANPGGGVGVCEAERTDVTPQAPRSWLKMFSDFGNKERTSQWKPGITSSPESSSS